MNKDRTPHGRILEGVRAYYTDKIARHGPVPAGVDWNGSESQLLRFDQLLRIVQDWQSSFSVVDLGCGYGQLFDHLRKRAETFTYSGFDVSEAMIEKAAELYGESDNASFWVSDHPTSRSDYALASGIFNVKLSIADSEWKDFVFDTLAVLDRSSDKGFAFNCLTSYSDAEKMQPHLYYADPCLFFDFCKRQFSRNVTLLHDYGLYEFTILVRK